MVFTVPSLQADALARARLLRSSGRITDAILELRRNHLSLDNRGKIFLAKLYLDSDKYTPAIRIYRVLCPRMRNANCWNEYGIAYMSLGAYNQAQKQFKNAVQLERSNSRFHSNLAMSLFYMRRLVAAEAEHRLAVTLDGDNLIARLNFAIFKIQRKRFDDAESDIDQVLQKDNDLFYAHLYKGYLLYRKKRYTEAIKHYDRGLQLNSGSFELYYYRALARYRNRNMGGALSDLKQADKIFPLNSQTGTLRRLIRKRRYR